MENIPYDEELIRQRILRNETNDCTVTAWANVFDCHYPAAHEWCKRHGRKNRHGMSHTQLESALKACKKAKVVNGPYSRKNRITVKQFCKKHPVGRFYVCSRGHAFCIKNGIVYDWKYGPSRQIQHASRVYLEGEILTI